MTSGGLEWFRSVGKRRVGAVETVDSTGTAIVPNPASSPTATATVTTLASTAASQQVLAANAARKGVYLANSDANAVLVKLGTTASASSYTVRIPANSYWEMPFPIYTGRIDAIWEADGAGSLIITEV